MPSSSANTEKGGWGNVQLLRIFPDLEGFRPPSLKPSHIKATRTQNNLVHKFSSVLIPMQTCAYIALE